MPDVLRALGRGRGFASRNASAARGSVSSVKYHNKDSPFSKAIYCRFNYYPLTDTTANITNITTTTTEITKLY